MYTNQLKSIFRTVRNENWFRITSLHHSKILKSNVKTTIQNSPNCFNLCRWDLSKGLVNPKAFWWLIFHVNVTRNISEQSQIITQLFFNYLFFLIIFETFLLFLCLYEVISTEPCSFHRWEVHNGTQTLYLRRLDTVPQGLHRKSNSPF